MSDEYAQIRAEYEVAGFDVGDVAPNPITQFQVWFDAAVAAGIPEANTMTLATVDAGRPTARAVLLKGVEQGGFVFFTNYGSDKGHQIEAVPVVALTFYWQPMHRQVRIEGTASKVAPDVSEAYFRARPRGAQLAAQASSQSRPIDDRAALHARFAAVEARFEGGPVPRPVEWGGYRVLPERVEFWQGQVNRLHDRLLYEADPDGWSITRLMP